jgi:hypothetical protein
MIALKVIFSITTNYCTNSISNVWQTVCECKKETGGVLQVRSQARSFLAAGHVCCVTGFEAYPTTFPNNTSFSPKSSKGSMLAGSSRRLPRILARSMRTIFAKLTNCWSPENHAAKSYWLGFDHRCGIPMAAMIVGIAKPVCR